MKIKIQDSMKVMVSAVGEVEFGSEFLAKVEAAITELAKEYKVRHAYDCGVKNIVVELFNVDLSKAQEIRQQIVQKIVLLAEHGPDSDLLDTLISRYPQLKTHPNLSSVVRAFENLDRVVMDALTDGRNSVKAEIQQRESSGGQLEVEDLAHSGAKRKGMTPEERIEFRKASILGQNEEQKRKAAVPEEPVIPPIYKQVAAKESVTPKEYGPPLPGDETNVFTRPAKK